MKTIGNILRYWAFTIPALLAVLLLLVLPHCPEFTETVFARGIFRLIAVPLGGLIAVLPFSLTEILAVLALPAFILLLVILIRRLIRSSNRGRMLLKAGRAAGWILSVVFFVYMLLHGLNFYRLPVSDLMDLEPVTPSAAQLRDICIDLAEKASTEREALTEDEDGCVRLSQSVTKTLRLADGGYRNLQGEYAFLFGGTWRAKPVQLSHWWSYTGITGMYFPMLAEANVNIDVPDSSIPATAAHELAHTRGFAREDECNFLAYLTCIHSDSADFRYSGLLMAYIYCSNTLYDYDKDLWGETREACSDGVKRDLGERNRYWKTFEGKVQEISNNVNNSFLTAQGQEKGVLSYDEVVSLIVSYYVREGIV